MPDRLAIATLAKTVTTNGYWTMAEDAYIGKQYLVKIDSVRMAEFQNVPTGKCFTQSIIDVLDNANPDPKQWEFYFMPTEVLQIGEPLDPNDLTVIDRLHFLFATKPKESHVEN